MSALTKLPSTTQPGLCHPTCVQLPHVGKVAVVAVVAAAVVVAVVAVVAVAVVVAVVAVQELFKQPHTKRTNNKYKNRCMSK